MTSTTLELRVSGTFSLKVSPSTTTLSLLTAKPRRIMRLMVCSAMYFPIPSLILRPDKIT
jgi:hypothetical protein